MAVLDAALIDLDDSTDDTVQCVIDYDWEENLYDTDDDGEPATTTTFYLDEDIYLLAQPPTGYQISTITTTSGRVVNLGLVTRTIEVESHLFEDDDEESLTWYPFSTIDVNNAYDFISGTPSVTVVEDKDVTCSIIPAIVDYSYDIRAYSLRCSHERRVELEEDDDKWLMGIVIEVEAI